MLAKSLLLFPCLLISAACRSTNPVPGGAAARGALRAAQYGCGACHTIPGIPGAHGLVGPSLEGVGGRQYIAGVLPNQPAHLERWIMDPQSVSPRTAMPNVGVTPTDAADISAYLYTLTKPPGGMTW